jgi:hypothetical protein
MMLDGPFCGLKHRPPAFTPRTEADRGLTLGLVATCEEHGWLLSVRPRWCRQGLVLTVRDPHHDLRGILARGRGRTLDEVAAACLSMLVARGHAAWVALPRGGEDDPASAAGFRGHSPKSTAPTPREDAARQGLVRALEPSTDGEFLRQIRRPILEVVDPCSEYLVLAVALGGGGVWQALERSRGRRDLLAMEGWRLVWVRPAPLGDELHLVFERPDQDLRPGGPAGEPRWSWSAYLP